MLAALLGKGYVFFYDDGHEVVKNPATRPSSKSIAKTLQEVARIIVKENPDIILLQEVDDKASRTDKKDQLKELLALLPKAYNSHTSAFYWKSAYVPFPYPDMVGKIGMKLSVVSKYKIKHALRHKLSLVYYENEKIQEMAYHFLKRQFDLKRAVQEVVLPVRGGRDLVVFNTHLEAFAQNTKTMEKQVAQTKALLDAKTSEGIPWIIGGDFNLLPPDKSYNDLKKYQQKMYKKESEIATIYNKYQAIPGKKDLDSTDRKQWLTHFPNDPRVKAPDRIIDYIFLSNDIKLDTHYIRQKDTWTVSDHLPVVAEIILPDKI